MSPAEIPAHLSGLEEARIVDVDVRDDLRAGREPFGRIMEARRALPPDGVLRLRAIFEPYPLYRVMAAQGMAHWAERLGEDDWRVWFFPDGGGPRETVPPSDQVAEADPGVPEDAIVLDVRGLEPPEPMTCTLEAIAELDSTTTLVQINERVPRFLLPHLDERGFTYHIRQQTPDLVRVFIRRKTSTPSCW